MALPCIRSPRGEHIAENPGQLLVLVTALPPRIGYDMAVKIGKTASAKSIALQDVAAKPGFVPADKFDRWVAAAAAMRGASLRGGGG